MFVSPRGIAVVLADVSRSILDSIDRGFLLSVLRQLYADRRSVRVFFFDTSLREVTAQFDEPSADRAIAALERTSYKRSLASKYRTGRSYRV
ncbi:VWA domain-containing protein [Natrialba sp. PRR66]|uniref:VWA domain-containing protein n=1 Tax=Natrialba sp. PRR66 TaxID=3098146 RepID=UPI0034E0BAF1